MKTPAPTLVAAAALLALLLGPCAAGARGGLQDEEDPCAPEAQRSPQLIACARRELRAADAELKRAREELNADLEPRSRVKLRASERLWLRYRKTNCDAEASIYANGTIQPLIELRCMARLTRGRAAELRAQLQTLRG
ncbi:MAG TPA: lysozyme inhibitor LprI family protein [Pyrinomonadaceae bacterium]|jgi:uncharacterized protein YecT (DUF1311 family)